MEFDFDRAMRKGVKMGFYIDPDNISKVEFFRNYCEAESRERWLDYRGDMVRVCLIDNGPFYALGIAYSQGEAQEFARPCSRPKAFGLTTIAAIEGAQASWRGKLTSILELPDVQSVGVAEEVNVESDMVIKECSPIPDRYYETSSNPCPLCGEAMTIGDEERSGICDKCYVKALEAYHAR